MINKSESDINILKFHISLDKSYFKSFTLFASNFKVEIISKSLWEIINFQVILEYWLSISSNEIKVFY